MAGQRGWFPGGADKFRPVTLFDVSRQRSKLAAEVDLPDKLPATRLPARQVSRLDRASRILLLAANEAWGHAGWEPSEDLPLVLGTTSGGMLLGEEYFKRAVSSPRSHRGQPTRALHYQPQTQGRILAEALGFSGPITIIANPACASGGNALGLAWEMIRGGRASRVLAGGYDALTQLVFAGFDALQSISPGGCRPLTPTATDCPSAKAPAWSRWKRSTCQPPWSGNPRRANRLWQHHGRRPPTRLTRRAWPAWPRCRCVRDRASQSGGH